MTSFDTMDVDEVTARLHRAAAAYLHQPGPVRWSPRPIELSAIWNFCEAVEDANPVYWEPDRATASRFGRLIAPPQALMALTMRAWWLPESVRARGDLVGLGTDKIPSAIARRIVEELGFDTATNVTRTEEYLEPFGPGDGRIGLTESLVDLGPVKRTRVGYGVFFTTEIDFVTEHGGRHVARARNVLLLYRPFPTKEG